MKHRQFNNAVRRNRRSSPMDSRHELLVKAAQTGDIQKIDRLLRQGGNLQGRKGAVLLAAILHNQYECVAFLLDKGANPAKDGAKALYTAFQNNDLKMFKLVQKYMPRDKMALFYPDILCEAFEGRRAEFIDYLVSIRNDVAFRTHHLLHQAAYRGILPIIYQFEALGCDVMAHAQTIGRGAIQGKSSRVLSYILQRGLDPNISNRAEENLFILALDHKNVEAARLLYNKGADPAMYDGAAFCHMVKLDMTHEVLDSIQKKRVDVSCKDGKAMHDAIDNKNKTIVDALVDAEIDLFNKYNLSFYKAIKSRDIDIVKSVLKRPLQIQSEYVQILLVHQQAEIFKLVCDYGYDPTQAEGKLVLVAKNCDEKMKKTLFFQLDKFHYRKEKITPVMSAFTIENIKNPDAARDKLDTESLMIHAARSDHFREYLHLAEQAGHSMQLEDLSTQDKYGNTLLQVLVAHGRLSDILHSHFWRGAEARLYNHIKVELKRMVDDPIVSSQLSDFKLALNIQQMSGRSQPKPLKRRPH